MLRNTKQRRAIRKVLEDAGAPLDAREMLQASARDVPGIGIATVYRAIKSMVDAGEIVAVTLPGQQVRYEIAGKRHHHHFHCRGCQQVFEVDDCLGSFDRLTPEGFHLEEHELILYGLCAGCAKQAGRSA